MKPQTGYARSHHSTLLIENLGNACRKASSAAASRHIGNAHIWHTCVLGSQTCAEFDRAPTEPTQGGRLAVSKADLKPEMRRIPRMVRAAQCLGKTRTGAGAQVVADILILVVSKVWGARQWERVILPIAMAVATVLVMTIAQNQNLC